MSQISEIKCPSCGKWSEWTGKIDEKCPHCGAHFEPGRMQYAEQTKLNTEKVRKNSYLVINKTDDPIVQMFKQFVNWLRWATFFGISVIYVVIAVMVIVYGLVML
jgi:hypothetical protein